MADDDEARIAARKAATAEHYAWLQKQYRAANAEVSELRDPDVLLSNSPPNARPDHDREAKGPVRQEGEAKKRHLSRQEMIEKLGAGSPEHQPTADELKILSGREADPHHYRASVISGLAAIEAVHTDRERREQLGKQNSEIPNAQGEQTAQPPKPGVPNVASANYAAMQRMHLASIGAEPYATPDKSAELSHQYFKARRNPEPTARNATGDQVRADQRQNGPKRTGDKLVSPTPGMNTPGRGGRRGG